MGEDRLVELESRLAFMDKTVETLSRALVGQQRRVDRLEQLCGELAERVRQLSGGEANRPAEEVPPHY